MSADLHALVGAYVLDALDGEERRRFEEHLERCGDCRTEVAELTEVAGLLGRAAAEPVPATMRARVLDEVDRTRQDPPAVDRGRRSRRWERIVGAAAAAVLVVVAVAGVVLWQRTEQRLDDARDTAARAEARADEAAAEAAQYQELVAIGTAPDSRRALLDSDVGRLELVWSGSLGRLAIVGSDVAEVADDRTYELWLVGSEGPVPAGTFRPVDGRVHHLADIRPAHTVGVTEEPAGGSPAPTGPILASAPIA